jgi:hypothetical protein
MRTKDCSLCAKINKKPRIVWQPGASRCTVKNYKPQELMSEGLQELLQATITSFPSIPLALR